MHFYKIFSDSFETFKVFNNIDVAKASRTSVNTPKSVWQILNHLIFWQEYQLNKLQGIDDSDMNESDTWIKEPEINDQELLSDKVKTFQSQIELIKAELSQLTTESEGIEEKLKTIQDLSVHLSFHLGEMILQMRQNGHYPMPEEMKLFLADPRH